MGEGKRNGMIDDCVMLIIMFTEMMTMTFLSSSQ